VESAAVAVVIAKAERTKINAMRFMTRSFVCGWKA
jgi:hypothetical protein